jgi:trehalose utilization protein
MAEGYPDGMHTAIADGLRERLGDAVVVRTATQDQPDHGLTSEVLEHNDVLTWWGHATHEDVPTTSSTAFTNGCPVAWACWCCTPATSRKSSSS